MILIVMIPTVIIAVGICYVKRRSAYERRGFEVLEYKYKLLD